jgi:cation transport ATPase
MNIPPRADKWIAFLLMVGLQRLHYSHPTGFSLAPSEWLLDEVAIAVLLTLLYVGWSALCRALARRLRTPVRGVTTRMCANATFAVFAVLAVVWLNTPLYTFKARIVPMPAAQPTQDSQVRQPSE